MALTITIDDVRLVYLGITDAGEDGVRLDADWLALANGSPAAILQQQKDHEVKPLASYPADVRDAIITLNNYAVARIKAAKGI